MKEGPVYVLSRKYGGVKTVHTIFHDPHPNSYASYLLMKKELQMRDTTWYLNKPEEFAQLEFNIAFLKDVLKEKGELHCEYCGKPNLIVKEWFHVKRANTQTATVDHFIPKSLDKAKYAKDKSNLVVACEECNRRKGDKIWGEETLKFKR